MFNTIINTPDNVMSVVGNAKVSADVIKNFSSNGYRRVDRTAQLAFGVDPVDAIGSRRRWGVPNVLTDPAPDVEILDFNERGTVLCVRPYCHTDHYWQVYFDTNKLIAETFGAAAYGAPHTVHQVRQG
jgi:small conductance mechanosensitive channel